MYNYVYIYILCRHIKYRIERPPCLLKDNVVLFPKSELFCRERESPFLYAGKSHERSIGPRCLGAASIKLNPNEFLHSSFSGRVARTEKSNFPSSIRIAFKTARGDIQIIVLELCFSRIFSRLRIVTVPAPRITCPVI